MERNEMKSKYDRIKNQILLCTYDVLTFAVSGRTSSAFTFSKAAGPSSRIGPIAASWHT